MACSQSEDKDLAQDLQRICGLTGSVRLMALGSGAEQC